MLAWVVVAGCATADGSQPGGGQSAPDAGLPGGRPDAGPFVPPAADASLPPSADASPTSSNPDAGSQGCTPDTVNLLSNASFEQGPGGGWSETSSAGYEIVVDEGSTPVSAQSPSYLVWLGGYLQDTANGMDGTDSLDQQITVPAGATDLVIAGYRLIGTEESGGDYDTLTVTLRDSGGSVLETLSDPQVSCSGCTWSNAAAGSSFAAFTLTPSGDYAGQTIRIHFESSVDSILNTNFFIDTLGARVTTACP